MWRAASLLLPRRARRQGALVGLVLVGYLVALGTTPAGEGLRLLGHLAHAHGAAPVAAPAYRADPATVGLPVLPTLRASAAHAHGDGERHTHAPTPRPTTTGRVVRARAETPAATGGDLHRHGATVHAHDTQAPAAPVVPVRVSVDTHRLPDATHVPAPPFRADAPATGDTAQLRSVDGSVDTPPPIGRG